MLERSEVEVLDADHVASAVVKAWCRSMGNNSARTWRQTRTRAQGDAMECCHFWEGRFSFLM